MKAVFVFSIAIAVPMSAGIGCMIIFEVFSFAEGLDLILKSVAAIALLGISTAAITSLSGLLGGKVPQEGTRAIL